MKHVIFYSWQSDLDAALTRNFIEEALKKAVKDLKRNDNVSIEAVVDRDTAGVAGTPGIAETIFQKIDSCDVFVCDVSIINAPDRVSEANVFLQIVRVIAEVILERTFKYRRKKRSTPNPNVLIELGYASARLGWNRVILVQNTAYGELEGLPFDLRGRRIVPFSLSTKESRPDERPKLREQLEGALRKALGEMLTPEFWPGESIPRWFGFWHIAGGTTRSGTLFIREVSATGFLFHLGLVDGARMGAVEGFAKFTGPDSAYARITAENENSCELKFRRTLDGSRQIVVEESTGCQYFKGMGATFNGRYEGTRDLVFESRHLDEFDLQRLYGITGQYYRPLLDRFQQIGNSDNKDTFEAKVIFGGAKGLYTIFEVIVMRGNAGQLWAAYIDDEVVRYFTTEWDFRQKLPKTIELWREPFKEKKVLFADDVQVIPRYP